MSEKPLSPFHLTIGVSDLARARAFYGELLGCREGRSDACWVDFDFFGHQLVCHQVSSDPAGPVSGHNPVDGDQVPIPHFGVVLSFAEWDQLVERLRQANTRFVIEPRVRFAGKPGEQRTLFLLDPSGNALEFKAFQDVESQLFARESET
ncbi:MAG: VOC family protein [Candidatus Thiodiazotropha sp.]